MSSSTTVTPTHPQHKYNFMKDIRVMIWVSIYFFHVGTLQFDLLLFSFLVDSINMDNLYIHSFLYMAALVSIERKLTYNKGLHYQQ